MTLANLEAQVLNDLACLNYGGGDWTVPRERKDKHVYDVVIIGGGQSGLGTAFGLKRERISNILVLDENPAGFEGPWDTYARMMTLRTPKELTSIDFGVPSLTFRAWWEAQHGSKGWQQLDKIPRGEWMDYLRWFRKVLDLPVRNEARLSLIEPVSDGVFCLKLEGGDEILARKVVLATGIQGGGRWHTPSMIEDKLPKHLYAHTSEDIDFAKLQGKRIAILGGGASAFDNAQHALASGVAEAQVFVRRKSLPKVNPIRFMERTNFIPRFQELQDDLKYKIIADFFGRNQPPTNDTFERAAAWPGFALRLGSPWLDVAESPDGVSVTTPQGVEEFDFLILSTGLVTDPALRPELGLVADKIARWSDRFTPDEDERNPLLDAHPYLGQNFQFTPRDPEDASLLRGLFAFNYSALASLGLSASALSGLRYALPRLVNGIADELFQDDQDQFIADYLAYDEPEFIAEWPKRNAA